MTERKLLTCRMTHMNNQGEVSLIVLSGLSNLKKQQQQNKLNKTLFKIDKIR